MFERAPFHNCPTCGAPRAFGILSAGGASLTRRCIRCRFSHSETLPALDKKVVYLDQFALSEIFKVRSGTRKASASSSDFWIEAERAINRASLLQCAIFPQSSIHGSETATYSRASELTIAHEMLAGEVRFRSHHDIQLSQTVAFASAFANGEPPPKLCFDVDRVLDGNRNGWLPDLHITAEIDLSALASIIRTTRDEAATEFEALYRNWANTKPSFQEALNAELKTMRAAKTGAIRTVMKRAESSLENQNPYDFIDGFNHSVIREFRELRRLFENAGTAPSDSAAKVVSFWDWDGTQYIPEHRISSYLFAALARKVASGQRKISRGMASDITAISVYGPYVDAMILDNQCAALLQESPLNAEVTFKARIFSMNNGDEFLKFLKDLALGITTEVRGLCEEVYGIK